MLNFLNNMLLLSSNIMGNHENFSDSAMKYINYVTNNYFANESLLLVYSNKSSDEFSQKCIKFLANVEIVSLELCCLDKVHDVKIDRRSFVKNTLILLNDVIPDEHDIRMMKNCKSWNSGSSIVILLHNKDEKLVKNFLTQFWKLTKVINATVMLTFGEFVKFYTLHPYKHFIMEELKIENLFPNKIPKNFNGTTLTAITTHIKPWVIISNGKYYGIEPRIIETISKHLNFRIEFQNPPLGENPFTIEIVNGKMTGTFGFLDRLEADILFHTAQIRVSRYEVGDVIATHTISQIIWVLPSQSYIFDWRSLFIMFKFELWLLLLLVSVLASFINFVLIKPGYASFSYIDSLFEVLAQLLSVPISYHQNGSLYRMFITLYSFYSLIIFALYQSLLIRFLTVAKDGKEFMSAEEALDDGLTATIFPGFPMNLSHHSFWNKALTPGRHAFSTDFHRLFLDTVYNKTMFFQSSRLDIKFIMNQHFLMERERVQIQMLDDLGMLLLVTIFTSKNHPLLRLLRLNIMRLVEGGLVEFWVNEYVGSCGKDDLDSADPFPLSLAHLNGIFLVWAGLLAFSFLVFVSEIIYRKFKNCK